VAADFCSEIGKPRTIAELTKERLRRTGKKIREENPLFAGDLGFRVFKLASSNIRAWEPDRDKLAETIEASIEHLKTDRTEQDILFELLLKLGLDLCVPIERKKVEGAKKQAYEIHSIGGGSLLVCLSPAIPSADVEPLALGLVAWHKALKPAGETTVVFRDSAFADDVAKTNLTAILHQHGLETVRSL
jgi:adenine-specific DNA-methyltransferase